MSRTLRTLAPWLASLFCGLASCVIGTRALPGKAMSLFSLPYLATSVLVLGIALRLGAILGNTRMRRRLAMPLLGLLGGYVGGGLGVVVQCVVRGETERITNTLNLATGWLGLLVALPVL